MKKNLLALLLLVITSSCVEESGTHKNYIISHSAETAKADQDSEE